MWPLVPAKRQSGKGRLGRDWQTVLDLRKRSRGLKRSLGPKDEEMRTWDNKKEGLRRKNGGSLVAHAAHCPLPTAALCSAPKEPHYTSTHLGIGRAPTAALLPDSSRSPLAPQYQPPT